MKKGTWVALGVLVALVGIYFLVKDEPVKEVEPPLVIEPVADLQRVEVIPPDADDDAARPDLIVFARGDTGWRMLEPVEADLTSSFAKRLDEAFSEPIETDDFKLSDDKTDEYGLTDQSGYRVALFSKGSSTPSVELLVGKQIRVPETGARRTYIKQIGDDGLYRARVALGELLRKPLEDIRSKSVLELPEDGIGSVTIEYPDGTTIALERAKADWTLTRGGEPVAFELDDSRIRTALRTYSKLRATGFYDPGEAETTALPEPTHTVRIEAGGESHTLSVGQTTGDKKAAFVSIEGHSSAYQIRPSSHEALTADANYFRTRTPNPIDKATIERIRFSGDTTIVIERGDKTWTLVRPDSDEFDAARAGSLVNALSNLRVHGYPPTGEEPQPGETVGRVVIETADAKHVLTIGQKAATDDDVDVNYARFDDGPVFYLKASTVDRLTPALEDLEAINEPKMPAGGMPKGLPKGMKMPAGGQR